MALKPIIYRGKPLTLHKTLVEPNFNSKLVLASDTLEYVEMWLKRNPKREALFYWQQAGNFFRASLSLTKICSPLTAYYAFLNATKALLIVKSQQCVEHHGVSGSNKGKTCLSNELVEFKNDGVLAALCQYLEEETTGAKYALKDILYNLPFVHRAYHLTFKSQPELFIPVKEPEFVKDDSSHEAWFRAKISNPKYTNKWTLAALPNCFQKENNVNGQHFIIRYTKTFQWKWGDNNGNLKRLCDYHREIRRHLFYIHGQRCLWYIKRTGNVSGLIDRSSLTLQFAAMHRLSELARYSPTSLAKHLESRHNWLLSEFIAASLHQYIDQISAEITGCQVMAPGIRN